MNIVESTRKGSYADVELNKVTRETPMSYICLLSSDGVTLVVAKTTALANLKLGQLNIH